MHVRWNSSLANNTLIRFRFTFTSKNEIMKTYPSRLHSQNAVLNFSKQGKLLNCPEVSDAPSFAQTSNLHTIRFSTHTHSNWGVTGLMLPYLIISHWPTDFACIDLPPLSHVGLAQTASSQHFTLFTCCLKPWKFNSKNGDDWADDISKFPMGWGGVGVGWGGGRVERCDF